jgi:hypothetical protein
MTQAGTDDNKQAIVEVSSEEVAAQGMRYIRGDLVTAVAASLCAVVALAGGLRYSDAAENDLTSVDEIVHG